jgi:N-methylhydantoinase A/oxoprolinase/acetone carboxylase beta subunit
LEMPESELIAQVKAMVMEKIATEVLKKLVMENIGDSKLDQVGSALVNDMVKGASRRDFTCKLAVNKPLIGIGAPVSAYLPLVAERFQTRLVLPEHSEVGNAAGAISGNIMETVEMLIKPKKGMGVMDNPPCTLFWMAERRDFETLTEALDYAKGHGASIAREKALASGADTVEVVVENHRKEAKMEKGWGEAILLEVNLTITGVGKPRLYYEGKH